MSVWVWKTIKHHPCRENSAWNPGMYATECDKDCKTDESFKTCTYMKSLWMIQ